MVYQSELSIYNDSLDTEILFLSTNESEKKKIKINANDLIKDSGIIEDKTIQQFNYFYNFLISDLKQKNDFSLKKVICSNLSFNRRIPLHEVKTFNELSLYDDKKKLKKEIIKSLNDSIHTVYYCNDRTDLIIACLYHFINNGYLLKKCPLCGNWFLNKKKKITYCSDNCRGKSKSIRELTRRKNDPTVALDKKIRDMLSARNTNEIDTYIEDFEIAKEKYSKSQLLKWLESQHKKLKKRGGEK